jgi:serine/threonine protein kinase
MSCKLKIDSKVVFKVGELTTSELELLSIFRIIPNYTHMSDDNSFVVDRYQTDLGDFIEDNDIKSVEELNKKIGFNIYRRLDNMIITMHENGILHGDLHAKNIVINPVTKDVRFIDFDRSSNISLLTSENMENIVKSWNSYGYKKINKMNLLEHEKNMWKIGYL